MTGGVRMHRDGAVAVLGLDHPPAQVLSQRLRKGLMTALRQAEDDPEVRAVILGEASGGFPGQVHPREFGAPLAAPTPADLADMIEAMETPVVALVAGTVAGAGAELALAAAARVAVASARFGFCDTLIGLPPSAGATQRLPRLIGAHHALTLLLSGRNYPADSEVARGVFDAVLPPVAAEARARELAFALADAPDRPRARDRTDGFADAAAYQAELARRRAVAAPDDRLAAAVFRAVEAAQLFPFEAGLDLERELFDEIAASDRARGLRHALLVETRVSAGIKAPPVALAGMLALGPGAARLCATLARRGIGVIVHEPDPERAARFAAALRRELATRAQVSAWRGTAGERPEERVVIQPDLEALATAELLIDLSADEAKAKSAALVALEALPGGEAPVLSRTRHLDTAALAPPRAAARVIGLHLPDRPFPARLAELVVGSDTSARAHARARRFMQQLRRIPIRVAPADALAGPALAGAMFEAADVLVRIGLDPLEIDGALMRSGFARGPYHLLAGMAAEAHAARQDRRGRPPGLSVLMARAGLRLGQGCDPEREAAALRDLVGAARGTGRAVSGHGWGDAEIHAAILGALVNEGARLLDAGTVARPLVIDVAMVQGYGFPRHLGGPMQAAEMTGLGPLTRAMRALAALDKTVWAPHPLLADLMKNGLTFSDLNA